MSTVVVFSLFFFWHRLYAQQFFLFVCVCCAIPKSMNQISLAGHLFFLSTLLLQDQICKKNCDYKLQNMVEKEREEEASNIKGKEISLRNTLDYIGLYIARSVNLHCLIEQHESFQAFRNIPNQLLVAYMSLYTIIHVIGFMSRYTEFLQMCIFIRNG